MTQALHTIWKWGDFYTVFHKCHLYNYAGFTYLIVCYYRIRNSLDELLYHYITRLSTLSLWVRIPHKVGALDSNFNDYNVLVFLPKVEISPRALHFKKKWQVIIDIQTRRPPTHCLSKTTSISTNKLKIKTISIINQIRIGVNTITNTFFFLIFFFLS